MKRYSIMARETGADREVEIAQVDTNPAAIVAGAQMRARPVTRPNGRKALEPRYEHVYFVDREANR